jgi:hypothetical protein
MPETGSTSTTSIADADINPKSDETATGPNVLNLEALYKYLSRNEDKIL